MDRGVGAVVDNLAVGNTYKLERKFSTPTFDASTAVECGVLPLEVHTFAVRVHVEMLARFHTFSCVQVSPATHLFHLVQQHRSPQHRFW